MEIQESSKWLMDGLSHRKLYEWGGILKNGWSQEIKKR